MPSIHHYLTTAQAAARLGISRQHVLTLIDQGRLRAERIGRAYLIDPAELDRTKTIRKRPGPVTNQKPKRKPCQQKSKN